MSAVPKNLRAFASMLEAVNDAIAILDKVETVEQFEAECKARVAAIEQKQRDELAALAVQSQSREEAARKMHAEAEAIISKAKADADAILFNAKASATSVLDAADKKAADYSARLVSMKLDMETAASSLHSLNESAEKAKKHCEEYEARIAKAKAELRKVIGD